MKDGGDGKLEYIGLGVVALASVGALFWGCIAWDPVPVGIAVYLYVFGATKYNG